MTKDETEITIKAIDALQLLGAEITKRLIEVDKLMIAAGELLTQFKAELEKNATRKEIE